MELVNRTAFTSVSASSHAHTPSFSEYSHPCNVLVRKVNGLSKKLNLIAKNMSQLLEGCIDFPKVWILLPTICCNTSCSAPPRAECGCTWSRKASSCSDTPAWVCWFEWWPMGAYEVTQELHHLGLDCQISAVIFMARTQLNCLHLLLI